MPTIEYCCRAAGRDVTEITPKREECEENSNCSLCVVGDAYSYRACGGLSARRRWPSLPSRYAPARVRRSQAATRA